MVLLELIFYFVLSPAFSIVSFLLYIFIFTYAIILYFAAWTWELKTSCKVPVLKEPNTELYLYAFIHPYMHSLFAWKKKS